jgi:hypothetical protein
VSTLDYRANEQLNADRAGTTVDSGVQIIAADMAGEVTINNFCRPFSHALVDDVERWIREGNYVHLVIDKIWGSTKARGGGHN